MRKSTSHFASVVGVFVVTGIVLAHDALTYSDEKPTDVHVNPLALNPPIGGPKNLPILVSLIDDDIEVEEGKEKERLVIVGGGWGTVGVLKTLDPDKYHVTVVAENTYNHFTPLLPSAAVGTVNVRSLVESLRKLLNPLKGHFLYGRAVDLAMAERLLEVAVPSGGTESDGSHKTTNMYIPYDKLIIAVGSVSATYGVNGLEHCFQLKTVEDAQKMRRRIVENFEIASLPTTSPAERKRLLSFVVCGGGPTGVETAAEISDLIHEDLSKYFPKLCTAEANVSIIQSRDHILNTYSESISEYAEKRFERESVDVITNARVKGINDVGVVYSVKDAEGKIVEHSIPSNCILWSTGIAMNPFTQRVSDLLPNQVHKKAIVVDSQLRVLGAPMGTVYAIGDASTINTSLMGYLFDLIEASDKNHDEKIDAEEWEELVVQIKKRVPLASKYLEKTKDVFKQYDRDGDQTLSFNELTDALVDIGNKITSLPATAQVASQQGIYIGKKLNFLARPSTKEAMTRNEIFVDDDAVHYEAFCYNHLGSLAYIGNAAVFDFSGKSVMGGLQALIFPLHMAPINWESPAELAKIAAIYAAFVLVLAGIATWDVLSTLAFDWSIISGKRKWRWPMMQEMSNSSEQVDIDCDTVVWMCKITDVVGTCTSSIILGLRTAAVWRQKLVVAIPLALASLVQILLWGQTMRYSKSVWNSQRVACVIEETSPVGLLIAVWCWTMAYDFAILTLCSFKLWKSRDQGGISSLLLRDGIGYFIAAFGSNLVQVILAGMKLNPIMNIIAIPFTLVVSVIAATTVFRNVFTMYDDFSGENSPHNNTGGSSGHGAGVVTIGGTNGSRGARSGGTHRHGQNTFALSSMKSSPNAMAGIEVHKVVDVEGVALPYNYSGHSRGTESNGDEDDLSFHEKK
ncbi:hypothetical protein FRB98_001931 [Tulasnella sp. 332]|nr:hypothetical protein FRB98_001931 [Tulasnella sp. 332]